MGNTVACALRDGAPRLPYRRRTGGAVVLASGWGHACALLDDGVSGGGRRGYGTLGGRSLVPVAPRW